MEQAQQRGQLLPSSLDKRMLLKRARNPLQVLPLLCLPLARPRRHLLLRLSPDSASGYTREWQVRTGLTPERHTGYAVQWFALAAALVVLCLWVALTRNPSEPTHER